MLKNFVTEIKDFIKLVKEIAKEFKRFKMPSKTETSIYLVLVLMIVLISSFVLFFIDRVFVKIVHFILNMFI